MKEVKSRELRPVLDHKLRTGSPSGVVILFWLGGLLSLGWLALNSPINGFGVVTALVVGVAALLIIITQPSPGVASPLTLVAAILVLAYAVRPVTLVTVPNAETLAALLDRDRLNIPLLLVCVFSVSIALGVWIHSLGSGHRAPHDPHATRLVAPILGSMCAVALALVALVLAVRGAGLSIQAAFSNPVLFRAAANEGGLFYYSGVAIAASWIPFWLALIFYPDRGSRKLVLIGAFVIGLAMSYPFGQRSYVLAPILGALAWRECRRGAMRLSAILPLVLVLSIAFGAYSTFRANTISRSTNQAYSVENSIQDFSARFDTFDFFAQTAQWMNGPYLKGRTLVDLIAQPIPRSFMPDKPSQTSAYLIGLQQPSEGRRFTPEYGLITELYINGGPPLVVLGGTLAGWAMSAFGRASLYLHSSRRRAFLVLPFLTYPAFWVLGGINSFTSVSFVLFMVVQLVFAGLLIRVDK